MAASAYVSVQDLMGTMKVADQAMIAGNIVYATTDGHVDKAKADLLSTAAAFGVVVTAVSGGAATQVQNSGVICLTAAQWDAVTGTSGGLVQGTTYYLSAATAGNWTSTKPTTNGQYQVIQGTACSTTEMICMKSTPVLIGADSPGLRLENRTTDPTNPPVGTIWLRTDL